MSDAARLLGFAFANADFLFEIDGSGTIVFATGAGNEMVHQTPDMLIGRSADSLFEPLDASKFAGFVRCIETGGRAGPFKMRLAGGQETTVSMFCLPQEKREICCTLSRTGPRSSGNTKRDAASGLATRDAFVAAAAQLGSEHDSLTLVDVPGLPEVCSQLGEADANKLLRHIGVSILEHGAKTAGRLSEQSFGVLASTLSGTSELAARVRKALAEGGVSELLVSETLISLKGRDLTPDQRLLAIRYVVDRFARGEQPRGSQGEIALAFHEMMDDTQARVRALNNTLADGNFSLAYQPIRHLKTGAVSHFEALARFSRDGDTGEIVRFIEALGIADALDLAVALKTLAVIESELASNAHIAFNVSGHTLSCPGSFGLLSGFLARNRVYAPRVLVEVTDSGQISDLKATADAVRNLRELGYRVGIGDFGTGPSSLRRLHELPVDFLKFHASLMRSGKNAERDDRLISGILKLCRELGVHTIATGLESQDALRRAKSLGFDLGQGHILGEPKEFSLAARGMRNDNAIRAVVRKDLQAAAG